jgi:tRNA modification GTPase
LSLTAAEGIADLLDAKTEEAALLSSKASRGKLSSEIKILSDRILHVSSSLWAYLDYPEEDLESLSDEESVSILQEIKDSLEALIRSFRTGRAVNSGISSVIVGKPNVGKSSFFNALLGENRAIVTEVPGTTRDVIEYPVKMGRVLLNLSDTAGVRENTNDRVESIGIEKALQALDEAELIFALFDLSRPFESDDERILSFLKEKSENAVLIPIFTKSDLQQKLDTSKILPFGKGISISNHKNQNFDEIISSVERAFISDEAALREGRILSNARQKGAISRTLELIELAVQQIQNSEKDLASLTLEEALSVLLEVDGKSAGDMILNQVFSRFCIGK